MKQTFLLSSLLLAASLGAAEFLLEPAKAEAGAKAPQIVTDAFGASLKFTASAMDAAAAKIPQNSGRAAGSNWNFRTKPPRPILSRGCWRPEVFLCTFRLTPTPKTATRC